MVPTGGDDILIPPGNSRILAARIPGARLKIYEEAMHGFPWQCAGEVAADVLHRDMLVRP